MIVIKRDGREKEFDTKKIYKAISKANNSVEENLRMNEEQIEKVISTVLKKIEGFSNISTEDIDDFVEMSLTRHNRYTILKAYIKKREEKREGKKFTNNEEQALSLIDGNSTLRGDNANKCIDDNGSISDYFAGILTKSINNKIIDSDIIKADKKGLIHWHDKDYSPIRPMFNCDLINVEDMLKNGFQMQKTYIKPNEETPFRTICNLLAQINLIVSGRQYGGQTISWSHTLPYIDYTRKQIRKEILDDYAEDGIEISRKRLNEKVEKRLHKEIYEGVKTYQYQILCHSSANGQTPFVSNNLCLLEAETEQEQKDFAMLIEEIFKRRIKGIKDEHGHYVTPLFPKLLYWTCDGLNVKEGDPYFYLTELAAKCEIERTQPDIVSERETRRVKEGQIIPSMGCVDKDEVVTYRFNNKVYVESIGRMWSKMSNNFEVKFQDVHDSYYIDMDGVEIYDSTKNDFVKCLRMNKNADASDWKCIKLSDGRSLTCTANHPLAVVGRGRTFVEDINIDECIECTTTTYNQGTEHLDADYAWVLGTLMCDGCYDGQLSSTFALNSEDDVIERYQKAIKEHLGFNTIVKEWHRGVKGNYKEVRATDGVITKAECTENLINLFGGLRKKERQIPQVIFRSDRETRMNFLGGVIDSDGYIHYSPKHNFCTAELGSTNKELALQQLQLALSLGYDAKLLLNRYNSNDLSKIRYRVYFEADEELIKYITCQKKRNNYHKLEHKVSTKSFKVNEIIDLGFRDEYSYDVTTESDRFDVSGIKSHNCRSLLSPIWEEETYPIDTEFYWVKGHGHYPYLTFRDKKTFEEVPNGEYPYGYEDGVYQVNYRGNTGWLIKKTDTEVTIYRPKVYGRWNNGVITVNLPHVALEARAAVMKKASENNLVVTNEEVISKFYEILSERLELCHKALKIRYAYCSKIKAKNSSILWQYGALARMKPDKTVGEFMKEHPKRASISLGYVGLYETCRALIGESNTTDNGRKMSKEILSFMNQKCYQWKIQDVEEDDNETIEDSFELD